MIYKEDDTSATAHLFAACNQEMTRSDFYTMMENWGFFSSLLFFFASLGITKTY